MGVPRFRVRMRGLIPSTTGLYFSYTSYTIPRPFLLFCHQRCGLSEKRFRALRNCYTTKIGSAPFSDKSHSPLSVEKPLETVTEIGCTTDVLDTYIEESARSLNPCSAVSIQELYHQYRKRAGTVIDRIVPYEESPSFDRRADTELSFPNEPLKDGSGSGDGIVIVIHALQNQNSRKLDKICVCTGFVVEAPSANKGDNGRNVIITCAHTLEQMHRILQKEKYHPGSTLSCSFIIASNGRPYPVAQILSSMPRSDVIALETAPCDAIDSKLRSLPLSPFPVYTGRPLLTHLFGSPDPPEIMRSKARLAAKVEQGKEQNRIEEPIEILQGRAWRRWGKGLQLGYRSYTGQEVEAGISSILPHILTSILPTSGSSGGPLVNAETGSVVGMISGRRMDNRVEGERGWGASAESIYEMFSLPGFVPTSQKSL